MSQIYKVTKNTLLKNSGYEFDLFYDTGLLGSGAYGRVMSSKYKNDKKSSFAIKYFTIFKNSDQSFSSSQQLSLDNATNEVEFLESLLKMSSVPSTLPQYYGHVRLATSTQIEFRLYLKNEGVPIKKNFENDYPKWRVIKHIIDQLIMTFAFLQSHNYIHRDLKPDNILISNNIDKRMPKITIIDFGLGRCIMDSQTTRPILTNMGGTLYYLSPERRETNDEDDQKLNHYKSDSFSLGLVFLDLLIGKLFKKSDEFDYLEEFLGKLKNFLIKKASSSKEEEVAWYCENIFNKMLERKSSKRSDFIDLYYSICNKTRKHVTDHLLFDFKVNSNTSEASNSPSDRKKIREETSSSDEEIQMVHKKKSCSSKAFQEEDKYEMKRKSSKKKIPLEKEDNNLDCGMCGKTKKMKKFLTLECSHKFCSSCLHSEWKAKIEDKKNLSHKSITCYKCNKPFFYDFLKKNLDPSLFSEYDSLLVQLCLKDSIISKCPKKECKSPYVADNRFSHVTCEKCSFKFCLSCKADWAGHGGLTCEQFKAKVKKEEIEEIEEPKLILKRIKSNSFH